jgi:hypothetical protein
VERERHPRRLHELVERERRRRQQQRQRGHRPDHHRPGVAGGTDVHLIRGVPGGTDLDLWFRNPGAGTLIVDFSTRRAFMNDLLHDVSKTYDELTSTWWDEDQLGVPPGAWTITKGPGAGTSLTVEFFSAWW